MTRPIRAFMMIRVGPDNWSVSVCRDLEAVLEAWTACAHSTRAGVLHIGFDRPPSTSFEAVAQANPGRFLLTASAKFGLPQGYEASADPISYVEDIPIYMGTRGWGYVFDETQLKPATPLATPAPQQRASGWVADFLDNRPDLADALSVAGIFDDASYRLAERNLPWEPRYKAGVFRFRVVVGEQDHDPCAIARAAPPWLNERLVETMGLTVRVANVFTTQEVKTVADIQKFELGHLLRIPNFGRKSANDLRISLLSALEDGPFNLHAKIEKAGTDSLRVELHRTLATLQERERDILTRRMGLGRPPETLQTIADDYDITRERIRQIENKIVKRLIREAYWDDLLSGKLDALLLGREFPLPVLGVEAVDKWFAGVSEWPEALRYILTNFCGDRVGIVQIDGVDYFGFLQQVEWETALGEAGRILSYGAREKWAEDHCKAVVSPLIKEHAREFRGLFYEKAAKHCHFAENDKGQRVLIAYGRGADQVVEAVLSDADRPLHYSEIAERASERQGRQIDVRRAHNAAAAVGILLAPGTYGLEKHLSLAAEESSLIREEAEGVVLSGPTGRQWHSAEIFAALLERDIATESLSKYVVDFVLRGSGALRRLGRMTWVEADLATSSDRIDIRQAVISLVQEAGRPLTTGEIHQRLVALRGVNETFQIGAVDPLIRLGAGLWGLNDRDLPIKREDQAALIEDLVATLQGKASGIHITEIEAIAPQAWPGLTPKMILSLASLDARLRVGAGQYLYIGTWGNSRRETLSEAVGHVLRDATCPLNLETIAAHVTDRLDREPEKGGISACLQSLGATFDSGDRTWTLSAVDAEQENEDDFAAEAESEDFSAVEIAAASLAEFSRPSAAS